MTESQLNISAIIPAAGVGKRMQADIPKQYLKINNKTILEHTVDKLLNIAQINEIILAVSSEDPFIDAICQQWPDKVKVVNGGAERVDSVLAALKYVKNNQWVMVHDAARPCVDIRDIKKLIAHCFKSNNGAILGLPVRDTMKRSNTNQQVSQTVCRDNLWHAQTPQMFKTEHLIEAIQTAMLKQVLITDEASAIESVKGVVDLVESRASNIKITQPDDLPLAEYFLTRDNA